MWFDLHTTVCTISFVHALGHTHEDIDAIFAHIWKKIQGKHCLTPQAYRRLVEEALTAAGRAEKESQVYELFAIPDLSLIHI